MVEDRDGLVVCGVFSARYKWRRAEMIWEKTHTRQHPVVALAVLPETTEMRAKLTDCKDCKEAI